MPLAELTLTKDNYSLTLMPSVVVDGVEWREVTSVRMVATVGHCHLSTKKAKYLNIAKESTYPTVCSVGN